ncbi:hypothetical protein [Rhizobium sp. R339]|uniref:hypothetical protein n=1 Tax=Rhizobium sp. R339 TaxID=1764273 RepID=UPI001FDAAE2F|nr:hypothetical protein [Rhizobium sp. R339]
MKRIGGCPAGFFFSAASEAAPVGKVRNNRTSNNSENRNFTEKEFAPRTIKSPQLYMTIRLPIASISSKPDFNLACRPASSSGDSLFVRHGQDHGNPFTEEVKDTTAVLT